MTLNARQTLDAVLVRLEADGPIDLHIEPHEYTALKDLVRSLWAADHSWSARQQRLVLAFLRAYTFYREVSEDENLFWASLQNELQLPQEPMRNAQYAELWRAFDQFDEVRRLKVTSHGRERTRREFVKTINAVWGIRVLRAAELIDFFDRYYNSCPGETITPALMRRLLLAPDDILLRQARLYDRIFRQMVQVIDYLLDHDRQLAYLPPEQLTAHLQQAGIELDSPNPVRYFAHKSEQALLRMLGLTREGSRRQYRLRQPRATLPGAHPSVTAHLPTGYFLTGQPVTFELLQNHRTAGLTVDVDGIQVPMTAGRATFPSLPAGIHQGRVLRSGQPTGSTIEVNVLPALHWELTRTPPHQPLIEGQWQVGRVTLADGRFSTFRWKPAWVQDEGWKPLKQQIDIRLDELNFPLELQAQSYGARLINLASQEVMEQISHPQQLRDCALLPVIPQGKPMPAEWRATLESAPHRPVSWPGRQVSELADMPLAAHDRLLIEFKHHNTYHRASAIPCHVPPQIQEVRIAENELHVSVFSSLNGELLIQPMSGSGQVAGQGLTVQVQGQKTLRWPLSSFLSWDVTALRLQLSCPGHESLVRITAVQSIMDVQHLPYLLKRGLGWAHWKPSPSARTDGKRPSSQAASTQG